MVILTRESIADNLIVTLNEKKTISAPFYLFVFENVTTKVQVKFVLNSVTDLSLYPGRYNDFVINTSVKFAGATTGQWNYNIYEQASSSNTNTTGLLEVECGKMILTTDLFNYEGYEATTNYQGYGG
jgi:hypothetical protein